MTDRVCDLPVHDRPRERLLALGPAVVSDVELVAILLRTGQRGSSATDAARRLLVEAGGLSGLASIDPSEMTETPGVGPAKAVTVAAAVELGRRAMTAEAERGELLDGPDAAGRFLAARLNGRRQEVIGFIALDGRHRRLRVREVALGTRNQAPVDVGELLRRALLDGAAGLLLFHNHPSGELSPSEDDLRLTRRVAAAGDAVGVPVLDHVIVAGTHWLSLRTARPGLFEVDATRWRAEVSRASPA